MTAARLFSCIDRIGRRGACLLPEFPHGIAMEDALDEINEILKWKDINDQQKAIILGDNANIFYNL